MVESIIRNRHPHVVGIGLDNNEELGPPQQYVEAFRLAKTHDLHVSAHAGERFNLIEVRDSVDLLGVERIDHGYGVVGDANLVARLREAGTPFTACWTSCGLVSGRTSAIVEMIKSSLNVTINTDAPASFATDLNQEYIMLAQAMRFGPTEISAVARAGIEASYLPKPDKCILLTELATYVAQFEHGGSKMHRFPSA